MILKKGVSGYTAGDLSFEGDFEDDVIEFQKICYAAVQQAGGKVLAWYEPDVTMAYPHVFVQLGEEQLYIFLHNMYDYIAFASNRLITDLQFVDCAQLKSAFEPRYDVLSVEQLNEELIRQSTSKGTILLNENMLNDVERKYMDHFNAQTVGNIVFNFWD